MCQDGIFLYGDCDQKHYHATYLGLGTRTILDIVSPREDSPEIRRMCAERLRECRRTGIWRWCKKEDRAGPLLSENMFPNRNNRSEKARKERRNYLNNDGLMLAGGCYSGSCNTRTNTFLDWSRRKGAQEYKIRSDLAGRVQLMGIPTDSYTAERPTINGRSEWVLVRHHANGDLEKVRNDSLSSDGS